METSTHPNVQWNESKPEVDETGVHGRFAKCWIGWPENLFTFWTNVIGVGLFHTIQTECCNIIGRQEEKRKFHCDNGKKCSVWKLTLDCHLNWNHPTKYPWRGIFNTSRCLMTSLDFTIVECNEWMKTESFALGLDFEKIDHFVWFRCLKESLQVAWVAITSFWGPDITFRGFQGVGLKRNVPLESPRMCYWSLFVC